MCVLKNRMLWKAGWIINVVRRQNVRQEMARNGTVHFGSLVYSSTVRKYISQSRKATNNKTVHKFHLCWLL